MEFVFSSLEMAIRFCAEWNERASYQNHTHNKIDGGHNGCVYVYAYVEIMMTVKVMFGACIH